MRFALPVIALVLVTDRECATCPSFAVTNNMGDSWVGWRPYVPKNPHSAMKRLGTRSPKWVG
ncbi:hypothetical protein PF005_g968 [Phytophthora fragariae]|uniref:Alpha-carbonic anhydrase domain-containing protein n=1 Tax=Phytophthora fragariae TaxID=53985 RepID=A0A6A3USG9_9STRA|nr:hypothetical protein PF003_g27092 [Phytophthora fragariae]KAE8941120.1 hypothetical protein PF009_g9080 [Phytophthora fragariae]KAE9119543.1 hypothetical protein PF007_g8499 [Phytophthora fragariae]KAE9137168.1 hypothetical protein PF010_g1433 [Phytophthora fragariae]KAE9154551.1 hypothetical protein PF006_g1424 [Phytophthora fragariae]